MARVIRRRRVNAIPSRIVLAHQVLGLPHPRIFVQAAEKMLMELMQQGYTKADIGRALGFTDFGHPGSNPSIQNGFQIQAWHAGLKMPSERPNARRGTRGADMLQIRQARAARARVRIALLRTQNLNRNQALVILSRDYSQSELARALKISRGRVHQIIKSIQAKTTISDTCGFGKA